VANATRGKGGTIATLAVIAALVGAVGFLDLSKKSKEPDEDASGITVHAAQTLDGRTKGGVIVIVIADGKALDPIYPDTNTWEMPVPVPKGASIGVGVWQTTTGTVSCAIRKNGRVVSNDLTSKLTPTRPPLPPDLAADLAAKCFYLNL
jgi:hypothetical protein